MNEANVVRKIRQYLDQVFGRRAIIFKHADLATTGIPDLSVTYQQRTTWLEVKHLASPDEPISTWRKKFGEKRAVQLAVMRRLEEEGNAFYIVAIEQPDEAIRLNAYSPAAIAAYLDGRAPDPPLAIISAPFTQAMGRVVKLLIS